MEIDSEIIEVIDLYVNTLGVAAITLGFIVFTSMIIYLLVDMWSEIKSEREKWKK